MPLINRTYNNILETLSCVCLSHGMVNTVSTGDIDKIDNSGSAEYPIVHIVPTSVNAGAHSLTYNFNVIAMDLVLPDESNEQDVLSDALIILTDIITEFRRGDKIGGVADEYMQDNRGFTLEPFTERFDDLVSGWNCSYSVEIPHQFNACESFNWTHNGTIFVDGGDLACNGRKPL